MAGKAINDNSARDCKTIVIGSPSNINAMVILKNAKDIDHKNITALSRLEHNRAKSILASCRGVNVKAIQKVAVWGNINNTIYSDLSNTLINGIPAFRILDRDWIYGEYHTRV